MSYYKNETSIEIIPYDERYAADFKRLNIAWLQKYFYVESVDEEMLSRPEAYIIQKGGDIFFAKAGNDIAGTFALMRINDDTFELGKMAVDEKYQGLKIGNRMLQFALEYAKGAGAVRVILFSNTMLEPAIHLYRKFGFREIPIGDTIYKRSNIKMERNLA